MRFLLQHQKDGRRMLHRATKAEPHIEGNVTNHLRRNVAQIQSHQPEAAGVQDQIRGAQGLIDVLAPHPQQLLQLHAGGFGGIRVESVAPVDEGTGFSGSGSGSQDGHQPACAARTVGTANLGDAAARQPSRQLIRGRNSGGDGLHRQGVAGARAREYAWPEPIRFARVTRQHFVPWVTPAKKASSTFAFCSPTQL